MAARAGRGTLTIVAATVQLDIARLDAVVESAIRAGRAGDLQVLGFGEITLVIAWPPDHPVFAVKRLPRFPDAATLAAYGDLLDEYVSVLAGRGVRVLPTTLRTTVGTDGGVHAYLVQPLVPRARLLTVVLEGAGRGRAAALLAAVAGSVRAAVDHRVGLDAQAGNWVLDEDGLACVDVSTPMLRDGGGRERLTLEPFLSVYPWTLRPLLRRVATGVMGQYHDPRTVLVDVGSNLVKERLGGHLDELLAAANELVAPPIGREEVLRYFRSDRRLWLLMQRLRRADRTWQQRVRRRPYPFLLPPPYRYGPMTPPGGAPP